MKKFDPNLLKKLYIPPPLSHKGQNGKLAIIGGSRLFHGPSLWALKVASRIVDMVFYISNPKNNRIAEKLKSELYDFIAVPRDRVDDYVNEADTVLIGPGLPREEGKEKNEESTRDLTERLLKSHSDKRWVIDAGSLTEMDPEWLKLLNGKVIITPHPKEFEILFKIKKEESKERAFEMAKKYKCVILLKGQKDTVCSPNDCVEITGGNPGMTKGGTGDVLAGLVSAFYCKNDAFLSASAGSFINKKAGESLFKKVGYYFNASDLADEIPRILKELL